VKGQRASAEAAPILVVAPHSSYIDALIVVYLNLTSMVAKKSAIQIPFFGSKLFLCYTVLYNCLIDTTGRLGVVVASHERSCSTLSPVSTRMGDRLRAGVPPRYVTKPTRSTQPCIPPGSLNRVSALIGWGKGGNVTSAGWQVTLCDSIWHMSSRSGEAVSELLYFLPLPLPLLLLLLLLLLFNVPFSGTTRVSRY